MRSRLLFPRSLRHGYRWSASGSPIRGRWRLRANRRPEDQWRAIGSGTPPPRPALACCASSSQSPMHSRRFSQKPGYATAGVGSRVQSFWAAVYPMTAKLRPHAGQSMKTGSSLTAMRRLFAEMSDECVLYTCLCRAYRRTGLYRSVVGSCRSRVVRSCDHRSVLGCWTLKPMKNVAIWPGVTFMCPSSPATLR
jgi:hypothetical protein